LLLHLSLAWLRSSSSRAGSPSLNSAWANFCATGPETPPDPELLQAAIQAAGEKDRQLIAGIAAYRRSPYIRKLPDAPCLWQEEETRLLDFGGAGPAVIFIPSLVNRAYILDLMPEGSMLRWLAGQGARPLLLDWGWPGEVERQFGLTDYIAGRLVRAIAAVEGPVVLAGYCMGGLLALAAALRQPAKVRALALLATPWDFHASNKDAATKLGEAMPMLEMMMKFSGTLPIDALQSMLAMIDPFGVINKFTEFAEMDKTSLRARRFVAMEDWLADGVPLAAPVARETLGGWFGNNTTARGQWRVAGLNVDPAGLEMPSFCAIPARDRLVPPESAKPLAALLRAPHVISPAAGHIGMVAGTNAQTALWQPFAEWLRGL
jgi:polyhydroxyalkanoate synthase